MLAKIEDYLTKNKLTMWTVSTEIFKNFSIFVLIQFLFIHMPKEFLSESFTCTMTDFQCGAGGCEAGWGINNSWGFCQVFKRKLIQLLLVMAGDVETNPGPAMSLVEELGLF